MGSKGSQTTQNQNQTQTYQANPAIQGAAQQAISGAESAASQPFQMPVAPVAGFNPLQQQVFSQYQNTVNQPYYQTANSLYQQSAAPVTSADVNQYLNPYIGSVTANLQDIFGQQNSQNTANLVQSAGGIGADRIAVGQANMAKQQDLAAGQTYSNIYQQALSAAQADKARQAGAAQGIQGLGGQVLSGATGAGAQQQQQTQAELNAPYQNRLAQLAYPFQTAQYLAGITGGLAPALGGTTAGYGQSVTTPPTPSALNQILGVGTAGLGLAGSMGAFNGSASFGGGNAFTDAYGGNSANPLPGLTALDYGAGYADGGSVENDSEGLPYNEAAHSIVPNIPLNPGGGHSGPLTGALNMQAPQQQQQSGSGNDIGSTIGNVLGTAAKILPFLKSGGTVPGYDDGGDVNYGWGGWGKNPYPATPEATLPPGQTGDLAYGPPPPPTPEEPPGPIIRPGSIADKVRNALTPSQAQAQPQTGFPTTDQGSPIPYPTISGIRPNPMSIPSTPPPGPIARRQSAPAASAATAARQQNGNGVPVGDEALPYPDALSRDWGQNATRSPWMSLVNAGATIAATPGPIGSAIGKGLLAGTKSLDDQRKELRSEQELNDKAKALYETAQEHRKKWNQMTPYERASIAARNRELDQEESGVSGKPGKFTGADYDRAAKFVQSVNPGLSPEQLQPLIDAEVGRRRRALAGATSAASAANIGAGDTATNALPDPGEGKRIKGKWYIGPTGQPQPWLGQ